ncbi:MAG: helix-turn-helix transcriptional regulator [Chitinophagaceae bacterium]|nr:helix-turn-helix transcriptional regulator [Chitinophagaceae bacterium]
MSKQEKSYDRNYFSEKIKEKLKADNISSTQAAKIVGVDQGTFSKMARAATFTPNIELYYKMCQWLGMPMEDAFRENVLPVFEY